MSGRYPDFLVSEAGELRVWRAILPDNEFWLHSHAPPDALCVGRAVVLTTDQSTRLLRAAAFDDLLAGAESVPGAPCWPRKRLNRPRKNKKKPTEAG